MFITIHPITMKPQLLSLQIKTNYYLFLLLAGLLLCGCSPFNSLCTRRMEKSDCGCDPVKDGVKTYLSSVNKFAAKELSAGLKDVALDIKIKDAQLFTSAIAGSFVYSRKIDSVSRQAVINFLNENLPNFVEEHNNRWIPCRYNDPAQSQRSKYPMQVILMDSHAKDCVYCQNTYNIQGSNSDDILRIISDLNILPYTVSTNLKWQDEQRVIDLSRKIFEETNNPAVIIIHASAFYEETKEFEANKKLLLFLESLKNEKVKILVYSRGLEADAPEDTQKRWNNVVGQVKELKGKAFLYVMEKGHMSCFDDPEVGMPFKKEIKRILTEEL